ncbi:hypothetical protein BH09MYX1_BH09MYX1_54350 [soil metagenome]
MKQEIRFCKGFDGARLAYALTGKGPALVKAPHWLTHVEHEWQSPVWRPWLEALSHSHAMLRMDERGSGLSDWDVADISFEAMVRDVESTVDAAGLDRFVLFGHSQGGTIAVEYAARHPERVSELVLLGAFMRGAALRSPPAKSLAELNALMKLMEVGWGRDDPSYRQMFAMQFMPSATLEQIKSLSELQRKSTTPENAARIVGSLLSVDVSDAAARVTCPTLIVHARDDRRIPFAEGLELAGRIPNAQLITLETENHILFPNDPAFRQFFDALEAFLPRAPKAPATTTFASLTPRELQVVECMAQGLDNTQIAQKLGMSEKTVRNNVTHVFDKLGVTSRAQAIVLARNNGLGTGS